MGTKIIAFLLTMTACITAAVISLFVLILAMNGYGESDAMWGVGTFAVLALLASVLASVGSVFLLGKLLSRQFSIVTTLLIAVPVFSIVGAGLVLASALLGVVAAEFVRAKV